MALLAKLTDPKLGITFDFYAYPEGEYRYTELNLFDSQTVVWETSVDINKIGKATIGNSVYYYINSEEIMNDFELSKVGVDTSGDGIYNIFAVKGKYYKGEYGLDRDIDMEWFIFPRTFAQKIISYDHFKSVNEDPRNSGMLLSLVGGIRACIRIPYIEEVDQTTPFILDVDLSQVESELIHPNLLRFEHVLQHGKDGAHPDDKYYVRVLYYKPNITVYNMLKPFIGSVNSQESFIDITFKNNPQKRKYDGRDIDLFVSGYTLLNNINPVYLLNPPIQK
jgi:hypothetical protein